MELKIVKYPLQDENTSPEKVQYPNEKWCVDTYMYRELDGGMNKWFELIERVKPDIVYLYGIKAVKEKISNGNNREFVEDIIYFVRAKLKINNQDKIEYI
jgi:hypothetical protein